MELRCDARVSGACYSGLNNGPMAISGVQRAAVARTAALLRAQGAAHGWRTRRGQSVCPGCAKTKDSE